MTTQARVAPDRLHPRAERGEPYRLLLCGKPDLRGDASCGGVVGGMEVAYSLGSTPVTWGVKLLTAFASHEDGVYHAAAPALARARQHGGPPRLRRVTADRALETLEGYVVTGSFASYDSRQVLVACPRCGSVNVIDVRTAQQLIERLGLPT